MVLYYSTLPFFLMNLCFLLFSLGQTWLITTDAAQRKRGEKRKNFFILPAELALCLQLKWKCRLKSVSSLSQLFSFQIFLDLCFSPNDPQLIAVRYCILCTVNRCCQELICKYTFPCFMYCAEKSQYIKHFCLYTIHNTFLFSFLKHEMWQCILDSKSLLSGLYMSFYIWQVGASFYIYSHIHSTHSHIKHKASKTKKDSMLKSFLGFYLHKLKTIIT